MEQQGHGHRRGAQQDHAPPPEPVRHGPDDERERGESDRIDRDQEPERPRPNAQLLSDPGQDRRDHDDLAGRREHEQPQREQDQARAAGHRPKLPGLEAGVTARAVLEVESPRVSYRIAELSRHDGPPSKSPGCRGPLPSGS